MRLLIAIKLVLLLIFSVPLKAQKKYWVFHKNLTEKSVSILLPEPENCSEWLGACSYFLTLDQQQNLREQKISISPVLNFSYLQASGEMENLGFALEQIEAEVFISKGLTGKGIKIGIIDGGFLKADEDASLEHFFENNLVRGYKDYVTPDLQEYQGAKGLADDHGTEVWQLIGGHNRAKNVRFGLATEAEYYLARTDHGAYERRIEEDYMIEALEWMEKNGVRLVNISLGYNKGYNDPGENYQVEQMDGKTTAIARAVEIAATEKGMLIVVAAGNEARDSSWQILSSPGDAEHVLTVGSSKFEIWDKMNYSSIGPEFLAYVKPDVVIYSALGTSYSTPIVTGLAACIWQLEPDLTNLELINILKRAGNFYPYPNNYVGYGVPTCPDILQVLKGEEPGRPSKIRTSRNVYVHRGKFDVNYLVAFHKKDDRNVLGRVVYRPLGKKVKIKRLEEAKQTSLLIGKDVVEIFWE